MVNCQKPTWWMSKITCNSWSIEGNKVNVITEFSSYKFLWLMFLKLSSKSRKTHSEGEKKNESHSPLLLNPY